MSAAIPPLAAEYAPWPTLPMSPAPDDVLTMRRVDRRRRPSTGARQYSAAWRVAAKWPFRCTRMTASHSSSLVVKSMRSRTKPALFTSTSSPPNVSIAVCTSRCAPSQSAMSSVFATASPPSAEISSTTSCAGPVLGAGAVARDAEIVHDDARALAGERERMLAADAAPGAGDDDDAALTDPGHGAVPYRRPIPRATMRAVAPRSPGRVRSTAPGDRMRRIRSSRSLSDVSRSNVG